MTRGPPLPRCSLTFRRDAYPSALALGAGASDAAKAEHSTRRRWLRRSSPRRPRSSAEAWGSHTRRCARWCRGQRRLRALSACRQRSKLRHGKAVVALRSISIPSSSRATNSTVVQPSVPSMPTCWLVPPAATTAKRNSPATGLSENTSTVIAVPFRISTPSGSHPL